MIKHCKHGLFSAIICLWILTSCVSKPEGIGKAVSWSKLIGWDSDQFSETYETLQRSCQALQEKEHWKAICGDAKNLQPTNNQTINLFFKKWFVPHEIIASEGKSEGLITGYYYPLLSGSKTKMFPYVYPIFKKPDDLLTIDLKSLYPELPRRPLRGRLIDKKVVPYFSRLEIDQNTTPLAGNEIVWVDDPVGLFFMHIQGSGKVKLQNGEIIHLGYADQNGHPYVAIGKVLVDQGEMDIKEVNLPSIREWLKKHPISAEKIFNSNPSYIFFQPLDNSLPGPLGSLNVPLTAGRSIAVDRQFIPLGYPIWMQTTYPNKNGDPKTEQQLNRLVFAQDTGGAIKGSVRADVFWGAGEKAEFLAGHMKQVGKLFLLKPKSESQTDKK